LTSCIVCPPVLHTGLTGYWIYWIACHQSLEDCAVPPTSAGKGLERPRAGVYKSGSGGEGPWDHYSGGRSPQSLLTAEQSLSPHKTEENIILFHFLLFPSTHHHLPSGNLPGNRQKHFKARRCTRLALFSNAGLPEGNLLANSTI